MQASAPAWVIAYHIEQIIALRQFSRDYRQKTAWIAPLLLADQGGVAYVAALRERAALAVPLDGLADGVNCQSVIECGAAAGLAMQAIEHQFDAIIYGGEENVRSKLQSLADNYAALHRCAAPAILPHVPEGALTLTPPALVHSKACRATALAELIAWHHKE